MFTAVAVKLAVRSRKTDTLAGTGDLERRVES